MLAISLHAVRDDLRDMLVPINKKYPLKELIDACRAYPGLSNARRITFEYVMLKDVNDSLEDAKLLVQLLKGIPAKINLIPFNPWPGTNYQCSDWEQIEKFRRFHQRGRLCLADPHAARPRHSRRLRPAEVGIGAHAQDPNAWPRSHDDRSGFRELI
jgi:adenine C2-methylase RlmN of 23S rRNA A2503 and tRNA A37